MTLKYVLHKFKLRICFRAAFGIYKLRAAQAERLRVYCCFKPIIIYKLWSVLWWLYLFKANPILICQTLSVMRGDARHRLSHFLISLAKHKRLSPSSLWIYGTTRYILWSKSFSLRVKNKKKLETEKGRKETVERKLNLRIYLKGRTMYISIRR